MQENWDSSDLCQSCIVRNIILSYLFLTISVMLYFGLQSKIEYLIRCFQIISVNNAIVYKKSYNAQLNTRSEAFHCHLSSSNWLQLDMLVHCMILLHSFLVLHRTVDSVLEFPEQLVWRKRKWYKCIMISSFLLIFIHSYKRYIYYIFILLY